MENSALSTSPLLRWMPRQVTEALSRAGILQAVAVPLPGAAPALQAPAINWVQVKQLLARAETYLVAALYLVAIGLGEYLTASVDPKIGVPFHSLLLFIILLHGAVLQSENLRKLLWAMALAPLIRVLSLSLPLSDMPRIFWYFVISIPLFASAYVVIKTSGYGPGDLLLKLNNLKWQIPIIAVGPVLGLMEYLILQPPPLIPELSLQNIALPALILLVSTGFSEELIFRGILQRAATPLFPGWTAAIFVNLVFAVLHAGYLSFGDILFVFLAGMLFSWFSLKSRSILGVTVAHGLVNTFLFLVLPFSGITPLKPPL